jgi:nitroreductase
METIFKRRSIRKFTSEPLSEEVILRFIKAGMNAPSAGNEQPWYFIIINKREILTAVADIHPYAQMLRHAPGAIMVCGDPRLERHEGYWVQDCAACTENILLEISDNGYGGVWIGVFPRDERISALRRLLNIPDEIIPFSIIAMGHPAESKEPNNKFKEDRIRYNVWK